jgi:hypothetical protein
VIAFGPVRPPIRAREAREEHLPHHRETTAGLVTARVVLDPVDVVEGRVVPARSVELGQLAHRVASLLHGASGELVALCRRGHVLEHQDEGVRRRGPVAVVAGRHPHVDRRRQLGVEPGLALVVPEHRRSGQARIVGGRKLDHDRSGQRRVGCGHRDPHVDADVAVADALLCDRADVATEHRREPFGGDVFCAHGAAR